MAHEQTRSPIGSTTYRRGFLFARGTRRLVLTVLELAVKPLADVVADYTRCDGQYEGNHRLHIPTSFPYGLGEVRHLQDTIKFHKLQQNRPQSFKTTMGGSYFYLFFCVFCSKTHASFFLSRSFVYSALVALSTARTMTPTSAKMAVHILAMPSAPRTRQMPLTPSAKTMFW